MNKLNRSQECQCEGIVENLSSYWIHGERVSQRCTSEADWVIRVNPPSDKTDGTTHVCNLCRRFNYGLFEATPIANRMRLVRWNMKLREFDFAKPCRCCGSKIETGQRYSQFAIRVGHSDENWKKFYLCENHIAMNPTAADLLAMESIAKQAISEVSNDTATSKTSHS